MKLALLNEFFYPDQFGGTGKVLSDLARRLADDHDWDIHAITTARSYRDNDRTLPTQDDWDGIRITRLEVPKSRVAEISGRMKSDLQTMWKTLAELRRGKYDAVLVSTAPPVLPFAAWIYRKLTGTPYFYIIYDLEPDRAVVVKAAEPGNWKTKLLKFWQKRWLQGADRVVAIGRCMKEHLDREYQLPEGKVIVIPVGDDGEAVKPLPKMTPLRKSLGQDRFIAIYSGNFGRYHNFEPILQAAEQLRDRPEFLFLLCGGGNKKAWVAEEVEKRGLKNVLVRDFFPAEEYLDVLATADVSLVTLEEGMEGLCVPSKFYSILASGRPTLALMQRTCEVARVIDEAKCGVALENATGEDLAKTLVQLASDAESLDCMGKRAREVFEKTSSSRRVAEDFDRMMRRPHESH